MNIINKSAVNDSGEYQSDSNHQSEIGTQTWLIKKLTQMKALKTLFFDSKKQKLSEHFINFDNIMKELWNIGMAFDDSDILCQLLLTLPHKFESTVLEYCYNGIPTLEIIEGKLLINERVRKRVRGRRRNVIKGKEDVISIPIDVDNVNSSNFNSGLASSEISKNLDDENDAWFSTCDVDDTACTAIVDSSSTVFEPGNSTDEKTDQKCNEPVKSAKIPSIMKTKKTRRRAVKGKDFECDVCKRLYVNRRRFTLHFRTHIQNFPCSVCNEPFNTYEKMRKHKRENHTNERISCQICGKLVLSTNMSHHTSNHKEIGSESKGKFLCTLCGKSYKGKMSLISHMTERHNEQKKIECDICGALLRQTSLRAHMAVHEGKTFLCTLCGKSFNFKNSLITHMRDHGQAMPFTCSICGRGATCKSHLDRHMARHQGLKPFNCKICGKSFTAEYSLKRHQEVAHGLPGTPSYYCEVCYKKFKQKSHLTVHLKTHKDALPQTCGICRKTFLSENQLQSHLKTHAAAAVLECKVCALAFKSSNALNIHLKSEMHLTASTSSSHFEQQSAHAKMFSDGFSFVYS